MAKTEWNATKLIEAAQREAGRIHDSADFLTATERDTFTRVFEMFAWIVHDRQRSVDDPLPPLTDEQLQPLRDWMREVGERRKEYFHSRGLPYLDLPGFNHRTSSEVSGRVVGITPRFDPKT